MTAADFSRWMSLYAATSLCCAIAFVLAVTRVAVQLHRERIWETTRGWQAWLLLFPLIWWRWQKSYLLSTPVTLAIVGAFALSLDWGR